MTVLQLALKIVIFIAAGVVARKLKVMGDGFDKQLSRFVMAIPLPCMIVNSFRIEFSVEELLNAPLLLGLSLLSMIVVGVVAQLVYIRMHRTPVARSVRFSLLFTNFMFFGLPVVNELYGAQGSFYYLIFTLPIRVMFYGGAPITVGGIEQRMSARELLKKFLCEPVVAVFIGLFLYVTQVELPALLDSVLTTLGNMASPLGLMLCGAIIADAKWEGILRYPCIIWVTAARLLLIPAAAMGLFLLLGVDHGVIRAAVCCFAMPVASLLPTFYLRYAPEETEGRLAGGYMVVASTLLCVATIPLWAVVMDKVL